MKVLAYRTHSPAATGGFVDRNPNLSYLVTSGGQSARSALIDASADPVKIARDLNQSKLEYILITHAHGDHTFSLHALTARFPDAKIGIYKSSRQDIAGGSQGNLLPLENGMTISLGDEVLTAMHTPGHTFDSVCFWNQEENLLFSGDTIFGGGIGCSAYGSGGNRNIFYQTIVYLIGRLSPDTRLYPGHFSEHYQTMPPYNIATEKVKNPYIINAIQGKRGAFDRDLKAFSIEFETDNHPMMDESEIDRICILEKQIWIPELQASRETILTRLHYGHKLLTTENNGELDGMIGWCYSKFSIGDSPDKFPRRFSDFSTSQACTNIDARSAFIYNVGVKAGLRQSGTGSLLLQWAFEKIRDDSIQQVFVDSRLPSYHGSKLDSHENIKQIPEFKEAVDRYFDSHQLPGEREFALDPRVRFYMMNGFTPYLILKDFIQDFPSNNMRVICYLNLEQDDTSYR
ncbi:MAG: hypothetical protein A2144_01990 [Chloroflexi bacterium RBG_16_50_9]|nr:MAG: hypothetical protein A2144_01990 [Chloroflexi bacterium RBG_16_50_9]